MKKEIIAVIKKKKLKEIPIQISGTFHNLYKVSIHHLFLRPSPLLRNDGVDGADLPGDEVHHNVVRWEVKDFAVRVSVGLQLMLV